MSERTAKLRVYYLPNGDGVHGFLVAAKSQKDAARLMGSSYRGFVAYGGGRTDDPVMVSIALSEPGRVWKQKISYGRGVQPWLYAHPEAP